ncbi:hypothetical protein KPH14_006804 [Odynerus spinipes]|uniref:Uncharacterized protein n=1 Tax=Odynerus spinipes TaxID=1348599 RepID=A0AAD9RS98_9HYME|nr:hypothetical protein KPH14_006804 [Odynerus spinipes]
MFVVVYTVQRSHTPTRIIAEDSETRDDRIVYAYASPYVCLDGSRRRTREPLETITASRVRVETSKEQRIKSVKLTGD